MLRKLQALWQRSVIVLTNQERAYLQGIEKGIAIGRHMADVQYAPIIEQLRESTRNMTEMSVKLKTIDAFLMAFKGDKPL